MVIVAVAGIVGIATMVIATVVGHRIADSGAAHAPDHSADWPAYNRPANGARHPTTHRSRLVG